MYNTKLQIECTHAVVEFKRKPINSTLPLYEDHYADRWKPPIKRYTYFDILRETEVLQ